MAKSKVDLIDTKTESPEIKTDRLHVISYEVSPSNLIENESDKKVDFLIQYAKDFKGKKFYKEGETISLLASNVDFYIEKGIGKIVK